MDNPPTGDDFVPELPDWNCEVDHFQPGEEGSGGNGCVSPFRHIDGPVGNGGGGCGNGGGPWDNSGGPWDNSGGPGSNGSGPVGNGSPGGNGGGSCGSGGGPGANGGGPGGYGSRPVGNVGPGSGPGPGGDGGGVKLAPIVKGRGTIGGGCCGVVALVIRAGSLSNLLKNQRQK